jgi:hypothetical protein
MFIRITALSLMIGLVCSGLAVVPVPDASAAQTPDRTARTLSGTQDASSDETPVPFLVRSGIPGVADVIVHRHDYKETKPLVTGEFDIQHYFTYGEVMFWMSHWADKYPDLVDVYPVGKTLEGRIIWQMTITNKSTGRAVHKPAMLVSANRHSGEVTTVPAAMLFAHTLLTGYGSDPEITQLVDTRAFFVRPNENPDGSELYLNTVLRNRSTNRPIDNNGSGLADDDIEQDLDGDGHVVQMRQHVGPGKGTHIIDPKEPRNMLRVGEGEGDYLIHPEGLDSNGDGRINSDGIGGLDLHRNYPQAWRPMAEETGMGWTQGGAGEYPLSEPEIRSMFLFLVTHPNISVVQSMDTSVPMHLRPPSTSATEETMYTMDASYYKHFDAEGMELSGYPKAGDVYKEFMTRDPERPRWHPLFGHGPDFGYFQYGAIWYGDELWGRHAFMEDYNDDGEINVYDEFWLHDNKPGFEGIFVDWNPYDHPQLGPVEIGGFITKFWTQNPPTVWLPKVVEAQHRFNMLLAKSLPRLVIEDVSITRAEGEASTLTVTVSNEGFLPDALKQAHQIKIVKISQAVLELSEGLTLVEGESERDLGFFAGEIADDGNDRFFTSGPWERSKTLTWKIQGTGEATVTIRSTRGGTVSVKINKN